VEAPRWFVTLFTVFVMAVVLVPYAAGYPLLAVLRRLERPRT
jgi:hypothetical protein